MVDRASANATVERIQLRYAVEVVESLGMCPWAHAARQAGRVRVRVCLGQAPDIEATLTLLAAVEAEPDLEVALLVYPELDLDRLPFARFVAEVRAADAAQKPVGSTLLAMADFHPNAQPDMSTPERLVPFVRRTPDPTLQAIRKSALDGVRLTENQGTGFIDVSKISLAGLLGPAPAPPLAARIARNNHRTIEGLGVEHVEAIFQDILRDRHESYAALGLARPEWSK